MKEGMYNKAIAMDTEEKQIQFRQLIFTDTRESFEIIQDINKLNNLHVQCDLK